MWSSSVRSWMRFQLYWKNLKRNEGDWNHLATENLSDTVLFPPPVPRRACSGRRDYCGTCVEKISAQYWNYRFDLRVHKNIKMTCHNSGNEHILGSPSPHRTTWCLRHTSEPRGEISRSGRTQVQFFSFNAHVNFPSPRVFICLAKLCFLSQLATVESSIKWAVKLTDSLKYVTAQLLSKTKTEGFFFWILTETNQTHR